MGRREYREEDSKFVMIKVPLFKLHSPSVKGAKVVYRESAKTDTEKGWVVEIPGIGMGSTKTFKVIYTTEFVSEKGECLQVFVPVVLFVQKVGVYKSGILQSYGIRAEVEGLKEEFTLRKRGCESLSEIQCANKALLGKHDTEDFSLSMHGGAGPAKYKRSWAFSTAHNIGLHLLKVFQISIKPLAKVKHEQQLDLEFELPGKYDYHLCFNLGGLHWEIN